MGDAIAGFLRNNHTKGEPVAMAVSARDDNRIANILMDMEMVGGYIQKPIDRGGRGWKFVVDPNSANGKPPAPTPPARPVYITQIDTIQTTSVNGGYHPLSSVADPRLFDVYHFNSATAPGTFRLRGAKWNDGVAINLPAPLRSGTTYYYCQVAGVHLAIDVTSVAFDTDLTPTDQELFFLQLKTNLNNNPATTTAKLLRTGYADGGDTTPYTEAIINMPLWYFRVSGGVITNWLNMRNFLRSDRAGN